MRNFLGTKASVAQSTILIAVATILFSGCSGPSGQIEISRLTCEYIENPMGIETPLPRLGWELISGTNGQHQTAYQVLVSQSPGSLSEADAEIWNSGRVDGSSNLNISFGGNELIAKTTYWWKVKVWDRDGFPSEWSDPAIFETGLLTKGDWEGASWIRLEGDPRTSPLKKRELKMGYENWSISDNPKYIPNANPPQMRKSHPSPLIRRSFQLYGEVNRARLYISGLGYHEAYLNGSRLGTAVLEPGQTSYDKRSYYVIHDLDGLLLEGENALGVMLGNGFYGQNFAFNAPFLDYGKPALLCLLEVEYEDGRMEKLVSDNSWRATVGPVVFDNVYFGESYDAREEIHGWDQPGFDASAWQPAVEVDPVADQLTAQLLQPIRKIKFIPPVDMWEFENGRVIYDLGQNIAGWVKIAVNEEPGAQIIIRTAEILSKDGKELNVRTIGVQATGVDQQEIYVCKGGGEESWEPRFTYHGFRFIEVEGISNPTLESLEGCLVRSDVERMGTFESSDELLNQIYTTSLWTIEDNLHSVPEDCPHREKCGWLGDAHTSVEVMNYNYNMIHMWIKFMNDVETNLGTGVVTSHKGPVVEGIPTNISVGMRVCNQAEPDWGAAIVLIPWASYNFYGDKQMLAKHYPHMINWMVYQKGLLKENILYQGIGDHCPPTGLKDCPKEVSSTMLYHGQLILMAKISKILGKRNLAKEYLEEALVIKKSINDHFFDPETNTYGSQSATSMALDLGVVPAGMEKEVARGLVEVELTEKRDGHFYTGILGTKRLYSQLTEYGYIEELFTMLRKKDFPSYHYLFDHGFTTFPETFNDYDDSPENYWAGSHNHPMHAGFVMWFHEYLCGIRPLEEYPAFRKFIIKPYGFEFVDQARATYHSVQGEIVSSWSVQNGTFTLQVEIPVNTSAFVFIPAESESDVSYISAEYDAIRTLGMDGNYLKLEVLSGYYTFKSTL